jgi:phage terminase small subunit
MAGYAKGKLTDREVQIINYYFGAANFNKTVACRMAGVPHAMQSSYRIFAKETVRKEIERRQKVIQKKHDLSYDNVMAEMAKIAFSNIAEFMDWDEETGEFVGIGLNSEQMEQIAALGEVTVETYVEGRNEDAEVVKRVKIKPYNKLAALEAIIRHAGLSKDKIEVTGELSLVDRLRAGRERAFGRQGGSPRDEIPSE